MTLREAIKISQEANDNVCLQHALSWLYCLTLTNKDKLIEHSILKSLELNLSYTMSFGIQCFVQYAGMTSGNPKQIFEVGGLVWSDKDKTVHKIFWGPLEQI